MTFHTWDVIEMSRMSSNPAFYHHLGGPQKLGGLIEKYALKFPLGLSSILTAPQPPGTDWFSGLMSLTNRSATEMFAVYAVVHTHPVKKPLIYIGSACSAKQGASSRISQHKQSDWNNTREIQIARSHRYGRKTIGLLC